MHPQARIVTVCLFLGGVLSVGLLTIFLVKTGTTFLEVHHSPNKADTQALDARVTSRKQGAAKGTAQEGRGTSVAAKSLSKDDFAAAFVTDLGHEDYISFSRSWRQGIKTYVATNHTLAAGVGKTLRDEHGEVWGSYPDDQPLHTLALKGDSRAALAPFLAFRELGSSFKWMFYGDDDTFFFPDAAASVLQHLDPDMPYFLTDHMWWTEKWVDGDGNPHEETHHPHKAAPQCVPCNYAENTEGMPYAYPRGCPCTPEAICAADRKGIFFKGTRGKCGIPRVPIRTYSVHGGAGGILSVGLLRNISFEDFEDCVSTTYTTGGDALISICLWQAGFGMTTPDPEWHPEGPRMFDVGAEAQADHEDIIPRVSRLMGNLIQAAAGHCKTGMCKLELDHFITLHMRSRKFPSRKAFSEICRVLAGLADIAHGRRAAWDAKSKDADQNFVNAKVASALQTFQGRQACQARSTDRERASCLKGLKGAANGSGDAGSFLAVLKESSDTSARELATEVLRQIFEHFPSSTGTFGHIPVGRE